MKNLTYLIERVNESVANRNTEALKDLGTLTPVSQFYFSPQKVKKQPAKTNIQTRVYYVERLADNRLRCILTGRILPQTSEGRLDVAQLHSEVLSQK